MPTKLPDPPATTPLEHLVTAVIRDVDEALLIASVATLDRIDPWDLTADQCRIKGWACDELERRYPAITPELEAWADTPADVHSYGAVVIAAVARVKMRAAS